MHLGRRDGEGGPRLEHARANEHQHLLFSLSLENYCVHGNELHRQHFSGLLIRLFARVLFSTGVLNTVLIGELNGCPAMLKQPVRT